MVCNGEQVPVRMNQSSMLSDFQTRLVLGTVVGWLSLIINIPIDFNVFIYSQ